MGNAWPSCRPRPCSTFACRWSEWSPESVLMQGVNRANGQEVNAGTTVVFQPLWDAEE